MAEKQSLNGSLYLISLYPSLACAVSTCICRVVRTSYALQQSPLAMPFLLAQQSEPYLDIERAGEKACEPRGG